MPNHCSSSDESEDDDDKIPELTNMESLWFILNFWMLGIPHNIKPKGKHYKDIQIS